MHDFCTCSTTHYKTRQYRTEQSERASLFAHAPEAMRPQGFVGDLAPASPMATKSPTPNQSNQVRGRDVSDGIPCISCSDRNRYNAFRRVREKNGELCPPIDQYLSLRSKGMIKRGGFFPKKDLDGLTQAERDHIKNVVLKIKRKAMAPKSPTP